MNEYVHLPYRSCEPVPRADGLCSHLPEVLVLLSFLLGRMNPLPSICLIILSIFSSENPFKCIVSPLQFYMRLSLAVRFGLNGLKKTGHCIKYSQYQSSSLLLLLTFPCSKPLWILKPNLFNSYLSRVSFSCPTYCKLVSYNSPRPMVLFLGNSIQLGLKIRSGLYFTLGLARVVGTQLKQNQTPPHPNNKKEKKNTTTHTFVLSLYLGLYISYHQLPPLSQLRAPSPFWYIQMYESDACN